MWISRVRREDRREKKSISHRRPNADLPAIQALRVYIRVINLYWRSPITGKHWQLSSTPHDHFQFLLLSFSVYVGMTVRGFCQTRGSRDSRVYLDKPLKKASADITLGTRCVELIPFKVTPYCDRFKYPPAVWRRCSRDAIHRPFRPLRSNT